MGLVNTSLDTFWDFAGCGWVCSTVVEKQFVSWLPLDMSWHVAFCVLAGLRPRWQRMSLVNTCWEAICVLAAIRGVWLRCIFCFRWHGMFCQHMLRFFLRPRWHGMGLVILCWGEFYVFAVTGWNWSTHADMYFVSSLAWEVFGQNKLRCILCPRWHWMSLVNTCWDALCVLAFIRRGGQHMLRCILCARWIVMGLVNTCRLTFRVLAGIG